jgi:dipeptidase E
MRLLLISSSLVHGYGYLDHAEPELRRLLSGVKSVAFVPFAQQDHEGYTSTVRQRFGAMDLEVTQVRDRGDVERAEAIFIGGGNTFRLLNAVYERALLDAIRARVKSGTPYIGSSAGTNVATPSIRTTNDMPILYPPSFDALGLVPFQINPHYLDVDPNSTHHGETREQRIREFHEENTTPVVGLREGSMLDVQDDVVTLVGSKPARIFRHGQEPFELEPGSRLEL